MNHIHALLILIGAAITISFSPIIVKLLGQEILGPTAIAFWRTFIGGIVLVFIAKFEKKSLMLAPNPLKWCLLTGFFFAFDLALWHYAIMYVGSGTATLLGNTHVFVTTFLSYLIFKEKISVRFILAAPAGIIGLSLLVGIFSEKINFTALYIRGIIFGFFTALLYSLYLVGVKKANDHKSHPSPATIMAWICFTAVLFLIIGSIFENKGFWPHTINSFSLLLILGIFGQGFAWWGIVHSMKRIAIHHAGLILLLQPTLAMIWGYLFFNEILIFSQIIGAAITLAAIYFGSIRKTSNTRGKAPQRKI